MFGKLTLGCHAALLAFCLIIHTAWAGDTSPRFAQIPDNLRPSVNRVLSSKPQDLFVVLDNGLTVLLRRTEGNDLVSAQVFVRAGSLYEGRFMTAGLSHYLEHVVSGGTTTTFTEAEAKKRLQAIGGETNAYTSYDRTVYFINSSAKNWKEILDLLISYVSESKLDPQEVAREKAVIQQEFKLRENNVDSALWNLFMKVAYQVHPVRNPVIGYETAFVERSRQDLLDYYLQRYQPENMVIAVVGKIEPLEVLQFIIERTQNFTRKANEPVVLPQEPAQLNPRWQEAQMPIARMTKAMLGFPSVSLHHPDLYALDVLAQLLGEGRTSRLYQRLKDQENKVLGVSASNWTPAYAPGQFIISLDLPPENWPAVMAGVEAEIDHFKDQPVSAEDLDKAKKTAIARHVFGQETISSLASSLASSYFDTGDPYFEEAYLDGLRGVTQQQVMDVAKRYLRMDRLNVAVIQPAGEATQTKQAAPPPASASPVGYRKLDNGLRVLLKQDNSLPLVTLQLYGLGGLAMEQGQPAGISALTSSLLTAGTEKRSKMDIARALEDVGGSIQSGSNNNTYFVSLKVLKDDLRMALDILADIVQNAQFPQPEIEKKRLDTLRAISSLDESWQTEIFRLFKKNYFKDSPYGQERLGTIESVQAMTRDQIVQFFRRMVNPQNAVLAIYGDFDAEKLGKEIESAFAGWHGQDFQPMTWNNETQPLTASHAVEKKNEKTSAALMIGTNGLDIDSERRPVLDVINAILSGAGTPSGRLFESLRGGQEDLVYLVGSFPFYGKNAGYFGVITQTTLDNLEKVQQIILQNLQRLQTEPVSDGELEVAKNILLTAHQMDQEGVSSQAQSAAVNEVLGLGWDYDGKYKELINKVQVEDIQRLAKELFTNTLVVRTIPEKPVEALPIPPQHDDLKVR